MGSDVGGMSGEHGLDLGMGAVVSAADDLNLHGAQSTISNSIQIGLDTRSCGCTNDECVSTASASGVSFRHLPSKFGRDQGAAAVMNSTSILACLYHASE